MKNSIPSDVWEKKRALIAKLYKDEEWPLKQVIKQIRSADFNPSETQLRSRLKKWRVTKPSRQTRKKSHDSQQDAAGDESGQEDASPKARRSTGSPSTQLPSSTQPAAEGLSATEPEWFMNSTYAHPTTAASLDEPSVSGAWVPPVIHQQSLSPSGHHRHLSNSPPVVHQFPNGIHDPSHVSSPVDGALISPASTMAPSYASPPYSVAPDSCLQSSTPTTTAAPPAPWSVSQWYSMPLEAVTQSHSVPFYTTAPLSPPVAASPDHGMASMPSHGADRIYSPQSPHFTGMIPQSMPDYLEDSKPWRRTMSVNYSPEAAGGHPGVDRQSKHIERKTSLPAKVPTLASQPHYLHGQHPVMCAPIYPYPGQESLVHKPSGIGF
ncbi:hypothetical protein MW887_005471 [Aspergillus wentii]|nr:hypothetical protein MW887_005471 [Aspergillus wentii]